MARDEGEVGLRLDGRWAVVTGGSKGIGLGIAERLAEAGANLVLVARDEGDLAAARAHLGQVAPDAEVVTRSVDVVDTRAVDELFADLETTIGSLDVFVANAGSGKVTPFLEIPLEEWRWTLDLNLTGVFYPCQLAAQRMVREPRQRDRCLLVVSSVRARGVRAGRLSYAVAKAGVNQFVRAAALELAEHRIRVNAVSPGITATPLTERNPEIFAATAATVPLGRAGEPSDMARAALFLCSPAARFVTGENMLVDGGEHLLG
ncbi:SDR family oxidoreductase [Nitriliruptoraceae bacterium ZYF776]|nr:SDR family oxidoreductase [Profundirhabdus halotolerans]